MIKMEDVFFNQIKEVQGNKNPRQNNKERGRGTLFFYQVLLLWSKTAPSIDIIISIIKHSKSYVLTQDSNLKYIIISVHQTKENFVFTKS